MPVTQRNAVNTGQRDSAGRTIYRGSQGGSFVLTATGKKRYITAARTNNRAPNARWATNANGTVATDPVSLNRIPVSRAVKVNRQVFDANTLREILRRNPRATNPLTRQPFPQHVYTTFGPEPPRQPPPPREARLVLAGAVAAGPFMLRGRYMHALEGLRIANEVGVLIDDDRPVWRAFRPSSNMEYTAELEKQADGRVKITLVRNGDVYGAAGYYDFSRRL